jgi:DNA polymerase IIIc chi subunit
VDSVAAKTSAASNAKLPDVMLLQHCIDFGLDLAPRFSLVISLAGLPPALQCAKVRSVVDHVITLLRRNLDARRRFPGL